ncbi:MAG: FG-GAP repeat protein [Sandaracinaceae bacterium]|nr:FG-GAP repeat protein [Sandaracinaceae bacterium]MBK8592132.1 FG-GAP repeat protein [Sandaracinaceae bacterium]
MTTKRSPRSVLILSLALGGLVGGCGGDAAGNDAGTDGAIACLVNQYVEDAACVACPPGTSNLPGDRTSGGDTTCDPRLCEEDERVQANACTPCPANTFNDAGDDASMSDTSCEDACEVALGLPCADFAEAYVKASTVDEADRFGRSVALDGDTLVVGAPDEDADTGIDGTQSDDTAVDSGAV